MARSWLAPPLLVLVVAATACGGGSSESPAPVAATDAPATAPRPTEAATEVVLADDIPVAHTPPGGWHDEWPAPVLAACTEPLGPGAPDLRGVWRVVTAEVDGRPAPPDHKIHGHVQRIEQCGDRLVVTAGSIIHDMRCDGTEENGVHDVAERDLTTKITVVATYEDGVHVLRPVGLPVEVTRHLEDGELVWRYVGLTARLERIGPPEADPATL